MDEKSASEEEEEEMFDIIRVPSSWGFSVPLGPLLVRFGDRTRKRTGVGIGVR